MCGIVGFFGTKEAVRNVFDSLNILRNRGKDGYGISTKKKVLHSKTLGDLKNVEGGDCAVGHCLHSIVGYVPQPLVKSGKLVVNCEIYNWQELAQKHKLTVKNDSELMLALIEKVGIKKALRELDGVYAFAYWKKNEVYIARDIIGVKPVWYTTSCGFAFASEKKALEKIGYKNVLELNPRNILRYDIKKDKIFFAKRSFFSIYPENKKSLSLIHDEVESLIKAAVKKRIPEKKFGVLLSGGVDSALITKLLSKDFNQKFVCYTAAFEEVGMKEAEDLAYSKKVAQELGLKLKITKLNLKQAEKCLKFVVPLIEDNNPVKVGVALTFYVALQAAKKDKVKVIFSGSGPEEIFAGYERHKKSSNINKECLSGLRKMYEKDTYRDDVVTMNNNMELRLPFLDKKLVGYALKIPSQYKLSEGKDKLLFREVAEKLGISKEIAYRKKRATQYGSGFDKALEKLAKKNGFKSKSEYLKQFYNIGNVNLGVLFSSGKDSCYALWIMKKQNYKISCLITIKSKNPDSFMFHTPNIDLVELQAEAANIPLIKQLSEGKKEAELKDLEKALKKAKEIHKIGGVVTGALFSEYQRTRIEKVCDKVGLKVFSPLWHKDQETEMKELVKENFDAIISSVAAEGLGEEWLGKKIDTKMIQQLAKLNEKLGVNIAGEGGEFESLVLDAPLFNKKIVVDEAEKKMSSKNCGRYIIKKAHLKAH
ncbi:diphthine--ammonia ligase [Candidatus Woesearchaeota archaeon]|nr:diphthine--ammonia ligase [Candidatus Woesearchaeota archaeon]